MSTHTQKNAQHYDVIVIGGGASGLMAAGKAAECGKRVLLIEKNKVLGKKLSITGGGRCNITNAEKDVRKFLAFYGEAEKFLYSPYAQFGMRETFTFFASKGLQLTTQAKKRVFPVTEKAEDVTQVMREYVLGNGVTLKLGFRADGFITEGKTIVGITTKKESFYADSFVLATGGAAHQKTGSTGEGIQWLTTLGHTIHASNPNLVPLTVKETWVTKLSGKSLDKTKITFGTTKETQFSKTGRVLFTHFGLSGPLILNTASEVQKMLKKGPVQASIDMFPSTDVGTLRTKVLEVFDTHKNKEFQNVLKAFIPSGMSEAVLSQLPREVQTLRVHSISKDMRHELVAKLKAMPLTITGTMGLDRAVISDGGVDLQEVDTKTMQSKLHKNLYFTGDVLHVNRPTGGFSLQLCWTTGWVAGSSV